MLPQTTCIFLKKYYLCIVFFIVLDLRLTKVGTRRSPFFLLCRKHPFLFRFMLNIQNNKYKVANKAKRYKSILYICIDLNNINFKTKKLRLMLKVLAMKNRKTF